MTNVTADGVDTDFIPKESDTRQVWPNRAADITRATGTRVLLALALASLVAIYFWRDVFVTVHSGEVGVLFLRFQQGTETDRVVGEGFKIIAPWDKLFIYNVRVQEAKHTMKILTTEGLAVTLHLSIRYHPEKELVGLLHQNVGPDYRDRVVIPEVESALRTILGALTMYEVYGSQRSQIQEAINESIEQVQQKFVKVDQIVLREVILPDIVRRSVEDKMTQQETLEAYAFRQKIAEAEARRILTEANGRADANRAVQNSLSPEVLRWAGIEATRELAKSPNAKTVVIGSGPDGLPLILGGGE